ncbi:MAG: DUF167 family protein [Hyphomicrobiales bacterium]
MFSDCSLPFSVGLDGLRLHIRLTPKGGRDAIDGIESLSNGQSVLKVRVRAVPEDGKANNALINLIADTLDCTASSIEIVSGATARIKTLKISGDGRALGEKLKSGLSL